MVNPLIFDIQFVQKIVRPDFFSQTSRAVGQDVPSLILTYVYLAFFIIHQE